VAKNEAAKGAANAAAKGAANADSRPAQKTAITPTRKEDYPEWYQQVVRAADLAESSPVRGCMVIKPWGYAIWENIQRELDGMFKATGHKNAYFPLFIPKSFLEKEAAHVEGFAKECAIVTHHRLVAGPNGGLIPDPNARLEEPLIVRPTSETIIGAAFASWVQSYRDLPLLINQWANVVRWELRTRLFLRTAEFLWQEGHTAHATEAEAREETLRMLGVYATFAEDYMATPVLRGPKTESERFPGAVDTYAIEAMMQDRKALQAGTSHFLGQNFAKASGIKFQSREEKEEYAWTTSDEYIDALAKELREQRLGERRVEVEVDRRDIRGGDKQWEWVKKGIPLRVEIGPRDVDGGVVMVARRDRPVKDKTSMPRGEFVARIVEILGEMQAGLFERARAFRDENTRVIDSRADFDAFFSEKGGEKEISGGFALAHWSGDPAVEAEVKDKYKVTIRCIPTGGFEGAPWADALAGEGRCIFTGNPSPQRVVFAKSY
jgi:prolyl-tRNA synthetase